MSARPAGVLPDRARLPGQAAVLVAVCALTLAARGAPPAEEDTPTPPPHAHRSPSTRRRATRHEVRIVQFTFAPAELTVAGGDTVVWTNEDILPHTVTADSAGWDSASIPAGQSFQLVAAAGRYPYHCAAHPTMHGVLVVR